MADNTNVNNNSAVVVVGRTAPVPAGQQKAEKSIPVVIAGDQPAVPVEEQNKIQSEVALSLLGIPRSEVALGIFADVNTYDVNPTEWTSTPEQFTTKSPEWTAGGDLIDQGWGLTHIPEEAGALIEAPSNESAVLTSKRFFRYQPGRVSSATFGVKTTLIGGDTDEGKGKNIHNPSIRKYGIFDNFDGYYWETRNNGEGDNFSVVRRTQSLSFTNKVDFSSSGQSQDYGTTNPFDPLEPRGSEAPQPGKTEVFAGTSVSGIVTAAPTGYKREKLGDLVIYRDNLMMTHAGCYDSSLLQPKHKVGITSVTGGNTLTCAGLAKSITNAVYDIDTGLMVVTTSEEHGYHLGKFITLTGIGMTCETGPTPGQTVKYYPNRVPGYNIVRVDGPNQFTVNVGVSTVPTFYYQGPSNNDPTAGGGFVVGLSTGQYVSYTRGLATADIGGLNDTEIFKVKSFTLNPVGPLVTLQLGELDNGATVSGITNFTGYTGISTHCLQTPVSFVQPTDNNIIGGDKQKYSIIRTAPVGTEASAPGQATQGTGMFPYLYTSSDSSTEGYIDTTLPSSQVGTIKDQVDDVNLYFDKWVNQNVDIKYWGVYEYRVPRSRFSGDRLDADSQNLLYSDSFATNRAGASVLNEAEEAISDISIWDLDFTKVTMYKVEFSWYGAVGALFLAYVPVSNGEARWVRVHHLRASNQLKVASLGNATLPITYLVYGGGTSKNRGYSDTLRTPSNFDYGSSSQHIVKYGASYYIDGGDRGTVKLFSYGTPTEIEVKGLKRTFAKGGGSSQVNVAPNVSDYDTDPFIEAGSTSGLATSYYIGSKVITGNPLDQNIEITYVKDNKVFINAPLNNPSNTSNSGNLTVIPNRVTPLIGIKCRDFIKSSTGRDVRNRTQVYPTRLSSGSDSLLKLDLIKSPIFQTASLITNNTGPGIVGGAEVDIGKRGKPTPVDIPLTTYSGSHTYVEGSSTKTAAIKKVSGGTTLNIATGSAAVIYNSTTGIINLTTSAPHGLSAGDEIRVLKGSLAFTCGLDNNATIHKYPRITDPIFDGNAPGGVNFTGSTDGDYSLPVTLRTGTNPSGTTLIFSVTTNNTSATVASAAEYIRDIGGGAYGYFRGAFKSDTTNKPITVLGYLENRGKDRTKNIDLDSYYFYALEATSDSIILNKGSISDAFVRETDDKGDGTPTPDKGLSEFTLDPLSSIKVNDQLRSPIPKTGTIVASIYAPASGEEYDLSPYFDFNKEYLSFPLTDVVDSLYICASSQKPFASFTGNISASLTWEEQ